MVCNSDCMRSRKRECKKSMKKNGDNILLPDELQVDLNDKCFGKNVEYSNCTFYCEKLTTSKLLKIKSKRFDLLYFILLKFFFI